MVKSRIQGAQVVPGVKPKYSWTYPALATVAREEGLGALYKGFVPKVLRLGPGGGVLLLVVEATLGLFRTGEWWRSLSSLAGVGLTGCGGCSAGAAVSVRMAVRIAQGGWKVRGPRGQYNELDAVCFTIDSFHAARSAVLTQGGKCLTG